ncbi:ROK family protein [Enterococcus rivorum]|uniref:N-acetylmannosamine kinase n=1 Tax=Enterococcus rivorum TaxID=762845 RepID=A0A1E5KUK8_9ENTE|nr:ROK family protein [Enterococcus rivorum]MBP2100704.1 putative NBD/HSP70 family sugar kinase [Enterococcus rivorum]OEH81289.1 N-acetylmannosamine kinase [Enterococcus rivorum]
MNILAFDLGGTAVKHGIWNGKDIVDKGQFKTPETWSEMKASLLAVFNEKEDLIEGVAFSAPGVVDETRQMIGGISAIPYIHRFNIFLELEELFHLPVAIENDANCAGLAEIHEGAAKGNSEVAFVVVGTGIGGAIFHQGELVKGTHLYGGEFGLMFLDHGKTFSELGTAVQMAKRYCKRKELEKDSVSGKEVFELAVSGDSIAKEEVGHFYDYLTKGLFNIQFSLDPEVIVLGGGVSAKQELIEEVNQRMEKLVSHFKLKDFTPKIVSCHYQNDANLVGAAANFLSKKS